MAKNHKPANKSRRKAPEAHEELPPSEPTAYHYWVEEIAANLGPEGTMRRLNHLGDLGWRLLFVGGHQAASNTRMIWFIGDEEAVEPEPEPAADPAPVETDDATAQPT